jgi:hypothetical protein
MYTLESHKPSVGSYKPSVWIMQPSNPDNTKLRFGSYQHIVRVYKILNSKNCKIKSTRLVGPQQGVLGRDTRHDTTRGAPGRVGHGNRDVRGCGRRAWRRGPARGCVHGHVGARGGVCAGLGG